MKNYQSTFSQLSGRITAQVSDSDNTMSQYASLPGVSLSLRVLGAYLGHVRANLSLRCTRTRTTIYTSYM
jgi:hypothetical protein